MFTAKCEKHSVLAFGQKCLEGDKPVLLRRGDKHQDGGVVTNPERWTFLISEEVDG